MIKSSFLFVIKGFYTKKIMQKDKAFKEKLKYNLWINSFIAWESLLILRMSLT